MNNHSTPTLDLATVRTEPEQLDLERVEKIQFCGYEIHMFIKHDVPKGEIHVVNEQGKVVAKMVNIV